VARVEIYWNNAWKRMCIVAWEVRSSWGFDAS
jgi:hypothetical protein